MNITVPGPVPDGYELVPGECPSARGAIGPVACNCTGACRPTLVKRVLPDPAPETVRTHSGLVAAQGGRTTAEWIADLAKARQAAEAERDALDATVRRLGSQNILMHLAIDNPESDESLLDQVKTLVAELDRHKRVVGTLNEMVERRDKRLAELEATIRRVEAVAADPDFANGHVSVVRIRAALADPEPAQVQQADEHTPDWPCDGRVKCPACVAKKGDAQDEPDALIRCQCGRAIPCRHCNAGA